MKRCIALMCVMILVTANTPAEAQALVRAFAAAARASERTAIRSTFATAATAERAAVRTTITAPVERAAVRQFERRVVQENASVVSAQNAFRTPPVTVNPARLESRTQNLYNNAVSAVSADRVAQRTLQRVTLAPTIPASAVSGQGTIVASQQALRRAASGLGPGKTSESLSVALRTMEQRSAQAMSLRRQAQTRKLFLQRQRFQARLFERQRIAQASRLADHFNVTAVEGRMLVREGKLTNAAHALTNHGPTADIEGRLLLNPKVKVATRFTNPAVMDTAIARNVAFNKTTIREWASTAKFGETRAFGHSPGMGNLGVGVRRNPLTLAPETIKGSLKISKVVMMADGKGGYHLQSSMIE